MGVFLQQSFAMFSLLLSFLCSYPSRFLRETFPLLEKKKSSGTNSVFIHSVCWLAKRQAHIAACVNVSCPQDRRVGMQALSLVLIEIYSS